MVEQLAEQQAGQPATQLEKQLAKQLVAQPATHLAIQLAKRPADDLEEDDKIRKKSRDSFFDR